MINLDDLGTEEFAKRIKDYVWESIGRNKDYLYRVFIYDCEPLSKNVPFPPLNKTNRTKNLAKTTTFKFRTELLKRLRQMPYFAVRLGEIDENSDQWKFKSYDKFKKVLRKEMDIKDLDDDDFILDIRQKGVDMKIGLDIATLANKQQVEKIILITADSDFLPAMKYARKESIIVQLDPMQSTQIKDSMLEHIDILSSVFPNKNKNNG